MDFVKETAVFHFSHCTGFLPDSQWHTVLFNIMVVADNLPRTFPVPSPRYLTLLPSKEFLPLLSSVLMALTSHLGCRWSCFTLVTCGARPKYKQVCLGSLISFTACPALALTHLCNEWCCWGHRTWLFPSFSAISKQSSGKELLRGWGCLPCLGSEGSHCQSLKPLYFLFMIFLGCHPVLPWFPKSKTVWIFHLPLEEVVIFLNPVCPVALLCQHLLNIYSWLLPSCSILRQLTVSI